MALLAILPAVASVIPVDLPPPDATPPAKDKPVKVYILSGQSNMVGMGDVKPASPQYSKIFLSADPTANYAALPVGDAGKQYDDFTTSIRAVLDNFGERYPQYKDQGYEIAGFVWWQGHKDGPDPGHNAHYEQNLVNLIKAWRKEFKAPNAPWTIATVGFHGREMVEHYVKIAQV